MPHSNQAKKRLRQSEKREEQNRSMKSSMKTHIKKVVNAINEGDAVVAKKEMPTAMKKIDKAVKKNLCRFFGFWLGKAADSGAATRVPDNSPRTARVDPDHPDQGVRTHGSRGSNRR